ncbi:hypothetical protein [Pedosphaera parvula]|nr:hypothetical protein [Pedosphaera parvula]
MSDPNGDPNVWMEQISPTKVAIWREYISHLRYLSDEVWKGMKLFLTINGFVLILIFVTAGESSRLVAAVLSILGILLTLTARYILKRNRVYYLQMLMKKTLLEKELGFYDVKFAGTEVDLALPWRLGPQAIALIQENPDKWVEVQIRGPGTIVRWLFVIYEVLMGLYGLILVAVLVSVLSKM